MPVIFCERTHRCRTSRRNSSLRSSWIGNFSAKWTTLKSSDWISYPPGARLSATTFPWTTTAAVVVHGKVVADKRAPGGYEIQSDDFKVVHFAEKFPIQEDLSEEFLLDVRHLWVRSQKMTGIFRVRHTVFGAVHEYFREHGFWEVQPPMITQ